MRTPFLTLVAIAALCPAAPLAAQNAASVRGTVTDTAGVPLADAVVATLGGGGAASVTTAPTGRFILPLRAGPDGPTGLRLVASRIGFAPETLAVADSVRFRLRAAPIALDPILVAADPAFTTASSDVIRSLDIQLRPRESSQELLRLTPGLVIAQHAGGGKAEQIFLRGFDADHGTDVAISVDGTPVNMVSHAHGQGYADLHFLLPEVVDEIDVRKGPYDARDGDLATAGAVAFRTKDRLEGTRVESRAGSFNTVRGLALLPLGGDAAHAGGYLAAAAHYSDGPFDAPQGYRRVNVYGKWTAPLGADVTLVGTLSGFDARWDASGQVPERAVAEGLISRFGSLDPTEGGTTHRYDASIGLRGTMPEGAWTLRAYAARYGLDLFSNFTFFLRDSVRGDGIEQSDRRTFAGLQGSVSRSSSLFGLSGGTAAGFDVRADFATLGLFDQARRVRFATRELGDLSEQRFSGWVAQDLRLSSRARIELGLRGDLFRFGYADQTAAGTSGAPIGSGVRWLGVVSPKVSAALDLAPGTTLFANAGLGFHSNDARDVLSAGVGATPLPRAAGAELGVRHTWAGGSVAVAAWGLDLGSELVYVGDEGVTEPSGRTRRIGLDLEGRFRVARWLWADGDLNVSRGRFRDAPPGADRIPLAPTRTATAGLTARDRGPVSGGMRVRHVGSRAADESAAVQARGYTLTELFGGWRIGRVRVLGAIDNLFDVRWNEAQFATTSRLPGEPGEGITELHFTPGAGRSLQLGAAYAF